MENAVQEQIDRLAYQSAKIIEGRWGSQIRQGIVMLGLLDLCYPGLIHSMDERTRQKLGNILGKLHFTGSLERGVTGLRKRLLEEHIHSNAALPVSSKPKL